MLAKAYSVTGLTCAKPGSINSSTGVEGVLGVESCTKRKRIALRPAMIRSGQNHIGSTEPEESGNKDYDDHDADDVKNVHCTLR
jgi:hypothetical protein